MAMTSSQAHEYLKNTKFYIEKTSNAAKVLSILNAAGFKNQSDDILMERNPYVLVDNYGFNSKYSLLMFEEADNRQISVSEVLDLDIVTAAFAAGDHCIVNDRLCTVIAYDEGECTYQVNPWDYGMAFKIGEKDMEYLESWPKYKWGDHIYNDEYNMLLTISGVKHVDGKFFYSFYENPSKFREDHIIPEKLITTYKVGDIVKCNTDGSIRMVIEKSGDGKACYKLSDNVWMNWDLFRKYDSEAYTNKYLPGAYVFWNGLPGIIVKAKLLDNYWKYQVRMLGSDEYTEFIGEELIKHCIMVPYTKILVRDVDDEDWRPTLLARVNDGKYYDIMGQHWNQCMPYSEGEYLKYIKYAK